MHSNVFVQKVISGKSLALTEYESAIASSEDVTPTHFAKKKRNFLNGLFNKKSSKSATDVATSSKPIKKAFSLKFNIMQRIRNASAKKSSKVAHKRHTPEGANLSVSETSLLDIEPSDEHTSDAAVKPDNIEPSTSNSSTTQPQTRIVLQNEIQPAKEEEAIDEKSESTQLKTFDTPSSTTIRRQSNVDDAVLSHMKSTPQPHSTSEVSITKVSVAPAVLCDLKAQTQGKGALQTVITTTSHLHQTRQRQVKTKPIPPNVSTDECFNRYSNDHGLVVQGSDKTDKDRRSSVYKSDNITSTEGQKKEQQTQYQLDPKVYI